MTYLCIRRTAAIMVSVGLLAPACSRQPEISKENGAGLDASPNLACPTAVRGPAMVLLPATDGSRYCMDTRETTRGEYDGFLATKKADTSGQPAECAWNTAFTPLLWDPTTNDVPPGSPYWCDPKYWVGVLPDTPVGCVDLCDAVAYCEWAGKRLCGRVGGSKWGRVYEANVTSVQDWGTFASTVPTSLESEFINACTQGGKTKYPYGDQFQPGLCIDGTWLDAGKPSAITDLEDRACHGSVPPFSSVYDLSGSAAEWQNFCWKGGSCIALGTAAGTDAAAKDCAEYSLSMREETVAPGVGIRCCADPVSAP